MTRGGLHWPSSTSRPETCWPKRGRSLRKGAKGQPESTPVDLLLSPVSCLLSAPSVRRSIPVGSRSRHLASLSWVVAGLVPATLIILALCLNVRGRRDKPGDDAGV